MKIFVSLFSGRLFHISKVLRWSILFFAEREICVRWRGGWHGVVIVIQRRASRRFLHFVVKPGQPLSTKYLQLARELQKNMMLAELKLLTAGGNYRQTRRNGNCTSVIVLPNMRLFHDTVYIIVCWCKFFSQLSTRNYHQKLGKPYNAADTQHVNFPW